MQTITSIISSDVFALCPTFVRGQLLATGVANDTLRPELVALLERTVKDRHANPGDLERDPRVSNWLSLFREFGANPKKFPPAHVALLRRIQNGNPLPPINNVVSIMSLVSIKHVAPCGGDDIRAVGGRAELTRADGSERFVPLGAPGAVERPDAEEVIYRGSGGMTMCRRFCWRNSHESRIQEDSTAVLMNFDAIGDGALERAVAMRDEAAALLREYCDADVRIGLLSVQQPEQSYTLPQ